MDWCKSSKSYGWIVDWTTSGLARLKVCEGVGA
jgi:hypothetical protein